MTTKEILKRVRRISVGWTDSQRYTSCKKLYPTVFLLTRHFNGGKCKDLVMFVDKEWRIYFGLSITRGTII